ncbi:MAG: tyrosine-protein phosphatase, partial [Clostridia bacterium]|nr:tyrosine-protein phosphatase [Clostridia bacterium]
GPFLIHCFLGKDRTGILSALLLSLAGVSRELIARDYRLSEDYVLPFAKREIENKTDLIWSRMNPACAQRKKTY